jgi:hypothetical protein
MCNSNLEFVRSVLGEKSEAVKIIHDGKEWDGLGIIICPEGYFNPSHYIQIEVLCSTYKDIIFRNWREFSDRNIRLWTESGTTIYAIPEISVLDILSYSGVGEGSCFSSENHAKVISHLNSIYLISPFEVLSASNCELEVKFIQEINLKQAKNIQNILIQIDAEVIRYSCLELYKTEDIQAVQRKTVVADAVVAQNGFNLHWE